MLNYIVFFLLHLLMFYMLKTRLKIDAVTVENYNLMISHGILHVKVYQDFMTLFNFYFTVGCYVTIL